MSEELLEKLREAGFPYITSPSNRFGYTWSNSDQLSIPDLSTLIEACGDDFMDLYKNNKYKHWEATSLNNKNPIIRVRGKTPEIAVAKLWLKLNTKN